MEGLGTRGSWLAATNQPGKLFESDFDGQGDEGRGSCGFGIFRACEIRDGDIVRI